MNKAMPNLPPSSDLDDHIVFTGFSLDHHDQFAQPSSFSEKLGKALPRLSERVLSQRRDGMGDAVSPTNSHPRTRTRSPSHSIDSVSTLLLLTTQRLSQETSRANTAEKHAMELLDRLKSAHEARLRMEIDLRRVQGELTMYKTQLDLAQKEIFRAQDIVEKVERQRVEAEQRASRDRDKARKLYEEQAINRAREEGRIDGYREGIERGRVMAQAQNRSTMRPHGDETESESRSDGSVYTEAGYSEPRPSRTSRSRRDSITQSQDFPRPRSVPNPQPSHPPEQIAIQRGSDQNRFHQAVVLPPDGYIPSMGADSVISLPPPHELSIRIPPASEKSTGIAGREEYSNTHPPRDDESARYRGRTGTVSTISQGSTRISQLEIVSPPRNQDSRNRNPPGSPDSVLSRLARLRAKTQPEQMVQEWRIANPDRQTSTISRSETPARAQTVNITRSSRVGNGSRKRQQREIILPPPITSSLLSVGGIGTDRVPSRNDTKSPYDWLRNRLLRTTSNSTVPNIDVVPPSQSPSNTSEKTVVNPVLLAPEGMQDNEDDTESSEPIQISAVLNDSQLPLGFVPLSPIPAISNLNPFPGMVSHGPPIPFGGIYRPGTGQESSGFSPASLNRPLSVLSQV